jgi:hypothetical protein
MLQLPFLCNLGDGKTAAPGSDQVRARTMSSSLSDLIAHPNAQADRPVLFHLPLYSPRSSDAKPTAYSLRLVFVGAKARTRRTITLL